MTVMATPGNENVGGPKSEGISCKEAGEGGWNR